MEVLATIWSGFIGSTISAFALCLLIVLAVDAARQGHRMYIVAVLGFAATLLGRMSEGFMASFPNTVLKVGGLLLAAVIIAVDLMTEEVVEGEDAAGSEASS